MLAAGVPVAYMLMIFFLSIGTTKAGTRYMGACAADPASASHRGASRLKNVCTMYAYVPTVAPQKIACVRRNTRGQKIRREKRNEIRLLQKQKPSGRDEHAYDQGVDQVGHRGW